MNNIITKRKNNDLDIIHKVYTGEIEETTLPEELKQRIIRMRYIIMLMFSKKRESPWMFKSSHQLIKLVQKQFPDLKEFGIRQDIKYVQRLYPVIESVDVEFKKMLIVHSIEQNINDLRAKGKLADVAREHKNLIVAQGIDKITPLGTTNVVVNVINYNPEAIGAKKIKNLDKLIEEQIREDEEKEKMEIGEIIDFEDIPNETI